MSPRPNLSAQPERHKGFPVRIGVLFSQGLAGYKRGFFPLTAAGAFTFFVYGLFRFAAANTDNFVQSLAIDLVGLVLAGTAALP